MDFSWIPKACRLTDLSKIGNRQKLKPRPGDEPHWQRLRSGAFVGYRPAKGQGKGNWFARAYDADRQKYLRQPLGDYGQLEGHVVFATARRDAEIWADRVQSGGITSDPIVTVEDACRAYFKRNPGPIAAGVFRRHVFDDPIASLHLSKLRRHHVQAWRDRLEAAPALISRSKAGPTRTKPRASSTVNRDMVPLRAALGQFLNPGAPNTDAAWQEALKPHKGADKRRVLYLDRNQRERLLTTASEEVAPFVRAMCQLPLRPGAIAQLQVKDLELRTRTISVGKDKSGRTRQIALPEAISRFLAKQAEGCGPMEPLFRRKDGRAWSKDAWKGPIKDAARLAELPEATTAYTLRHSVITDLIRHGVPALTVAQLSGTSVAMIERHYGHLVREDAEAALERLIL
ncbi:site-specific tyrosine recombinase XerC [Paraurantiacibacter namhicola]|uniref:Site-specific tyrosine recombinase XerC n=2 Tax=Paraurantiacibacter namhicola TaxID=645517 RepID=A0A1C7DB80_9SPHN|nr:site-specific tyrosine recombinase XerC [Paraurantiacibacter namhicola]